MKKLLLLIFVLIISGCSSEYNLVIDENVIKEDVAITIPSSVANEDIIESQTSLKTSVYRNNAYFYDFNSTKDNDNYYLNYSFDHSVNKFTNSHFLRTCYASNNVENTDDYIYISTSERFNCIVMPDNAYMDSVKVNIVTNLKVLNNNADIIDGNKYTWMFDSSNYTNKPIIIKLKKEKKKEQLLTTDNSSFLSFFTILIILGFIVTSIVFIVRHISIKKNEI